MMMDDATLRQVRSADPERSTWVAANAGSGKTRVLTDRVARLLLRGVPPQKILCLTYTKAAASEMQVRLFRTLGGWAMAPDAALTGSLSALGEPGPFSTEDLARARRMFATAIETPGGLKIQTIHAFCAAVLRRFPLEAGVSPAFREIDSRAAARLRAEVLDALALADPGLFAEFAAEAGADLGSLAQEIAGAGSFEAERERIWRAHDLPPGYDEAALAAACGFEHADAEAVSAMARAPFEAPTDLKTSDRLAPLADRPLETADLPVLETVFLNGAKTKEPFSAKLGKVPTKKGQPLVAEHLARLDDLMGRVEAARPMRVALAAAGRSWLLHRFGRAFTQAYGAAKSRRGLLDFDDLLLKTRQLLSDPAVSDWVLFGLDGGIDHVLVDEAQDTSPVQWDVIEYLTREFTAGIGARGETLRTIFVVGDKKQSIYSFQGARPEAFDAMRNTYAERLAAVGQGLAEVELLHSFRSAAAILGFVDRALGPVAAQGLGPAPRHIAFHEGRPGRVDLWPMIAAEEAAEDDTPWYEPLDRVGSDHPARRLAAGVAAEVAEVLARGERIVTKDGPRRIRPGDILVLVQRRSGLLFREILNRLKSAGLPVAGADLLDLDTELAVSDLRSLLAFLANEDDDLALAEALRSPLLGLDEDGLFRVAHGRPGTLWRSLRERLPAGSPVREMLDDLRAVADFRRPFDVLDRILTRHGGRQRLLARLGPEAEEGIDALLSLALQYETAEPASLSGFLTWLAQDDVKVKRQTDNAGDQIRVMTAHGAKGLEAPVVILPDMGSRRRNARGDGMLRDEQGVLWKPTGGDLDARAARALQTKIAREEEEALRLLYVSMTRAESWLILCGAGEAKDGSWYDLVAQGFGGLDTTALETPAGPGQRFQTGDWPEPVAPDTAPDGAAADLPGWVRQHPPTPAEAPRVLSPSRLGGAKALPSETGLPSDEAMAHGTLVHRLLELLPGEPPASWAAVAESLGAGPSALAEARRVIETPGLAHVFAETTLAEVDVTAALPELDGSRLRGTIDRLIIGPDSLLAVDFKTNAAVPASPPEVPDGLLRQMGAYAAALGQAFPDRQVHTALLWTRTAELMRLPQELVTAALRAAPAS